MKRLPVLFLLFILASCAAQPRTVVFNNISYQTQTTGVNTETYRSLDGRTLQVERGAESTTVTVDRQVYLVTGSETQFEVTFPDGRELARQYYESGSSGMTGLGVDASLEDWDRVDELREIVFHTDANQQTNQSGQKILLGAFIFAVGLLQLTRPRLAWQISEGWRYQNLEPSDLYLTLSRMAGVVLMVVAVFVAFGT